MRNAVLVSIAILLTGCLAEPKTEEQNVAPVLATIGDRYAVAANALVIQLSAGDQNGDGITYSADGTVGPNLNPFMQTTPAVFDATNARFTWTPTTAQADQKYSVKFTATDRASSPMSDTETVTIEVHATAELGGEAIYTRYCFECHDLDTGGNTDGSKDIGGKTVTQINNALQNVLQMQSLKSQLNDAEKIWLETYLATL